MAEFNPVLVKELRGRMRGPRPFIILTVYLLILSVVTLLLYIALADSAGSELNAGQWIGKGLFLTIAGVALVEVCVLTPALTADSIAGEKERETYDLLIASLLSPWQIVWGKLAAALAFALLLILAVVPLMSLAFLFGGVSLAEVLIALIGLLTTAVFYATVGLFWSSLMGTSLSATSLSLGTILLLLLGIPFMALIFSLILENRPTNSWFGAALIVYLGGAALATHPFIALTITENMLSEGESPFFNVINYGSTRFLIPSPWLAYVILAMLISAILISLSVRMIRPVEHERQGRRSRRASREPDSR